MPLCLDQNICVYPVPCFSLSWVEKMQFIITDCWHNVQRCSATAYAHHIFGLQ